MGGERYVSASAGVKPTKLHHSGGGVEQAFQKRSSGSRQHGIWRLLQDERLGREFQGPSVGTETGAGFGALNWQKMEKKVACKEGRTGVCGAFRETEG